MPEQLEPPEQPEPAEQLEPPEQPKRRASRVVTAAGFVGVFLVGVALGLIGTLQATQQLTWGPLHLSVGALIAASTNAGFGLFAVWGLRSRDAALLPGLGWFTVIAFVAFGPHPGGDVVLPGSGWDVGAFAAAGVAGSAVAAVFAGRVQARGQASPQPAVDR